MKKFILILVVLGLAMGCEQPKPGGGDDGNGGNGSVRDEVQNDAKDGMKQDFVVYGDKTTKNSTNPQKFDFPTYFKKNASGFLNPVGSYNRYKAADGQTYWYAVERTFGGQRIVEWGIVGQKNKNKFDW